MHKFSSSAPEGFWDYHGKRIDWIKPFAKVMFSGPADVG
jgi:acetyl-CoA synthetase